MDKKAETAELTWTRKTAIAVDNALKGLQGYPKANHVKVIESVLDAAQQGCFTREDMWKAYKDSNTTWNTYDKDGLKGCRAEFDQFMKDNYPDL